MHTFESLSPASSRRATKGSGGGGQQAYHSSHIPRAKGKGIHPGGSYPSRWHEELDANGLPPGFTQVPSISVSSSGQALEGELMPPGAFGASMRMLKGSSTSWVAPQSSLGLRQLGMTGRARPLNYEVPSLWNAYTRNEMVFAAIELKASSAINPRLMVQTRTSASEGGDWEESLGHPFRALMMRPNPDMDEAAFIRAYHTSMDVAGEFYAEITRNQRSGLPEGLYPLDPAKIAPIFDANGIRAYQFKDGMYEVEIPAQNMLVRRAYNLQSKWKGLSKLAVCLGSVDADSAQTEYIREFFNNGGIPSGLLKVKGKRLTEAQASELGAKWQRKYGRATRNQHGVAVLDEDADYTKVGANLDELESQNIRAFTESRICMVFGIPPLIIYSYTGLLRATYSNLREAWDNYWQGTLTVAYTELRSWLTWALLPQFVPEAMIKAELIRLEWDMSRVPYLEESQADKESRALARFTAGVITLNECRAIMGEQPDPAGDYYLRNGQLIEVPAGELEPVTTSSTGEGDVTPEPDPEELVEVPAKSLPYLLALNTQLKGRASRVALEREIQRVAQRSIGADWEAIHERARRIAGEA